VSPVAQRLTCGAKPAEEMETAHSQDVEDGDDDPAAHARIVPGGAGVASRPAEAEGGRDAARKRYRGRNRCPDEATVPRGPRRQPAPPESTSGGPRRFRSRPDRRGRATHLDGISTEAGHIKVKFHNEQGDIEFTPAALHIDGRLGVSKTIFGDAFQFLQQTVTKNVPKLTIPSPSMVHYRGGRAAIDQDVYPDLDAFWADLVAAYREEVRRLGELGCTYLQFDDTSLAYMNDPHQREYIASIGGDAERQHVEYIHHINEALADRPAGMSVTTHMCRGNFRSAWAAEGSYDFVAEALLNELEVDGYFMEWDDERSGGFEPLRFLPKGDKHVVLGLVTTKRGELESKDELKRRIEEAAKHAPIEQLCLSPQCGFSSTVEGNVLSEEEQWAKLRLIVEVAQEVWG
jgi:5-methyltetrahydropteroyltriglutamate--homocysteine methyltransferase